MTKTIRLPKLNNLTPTLDSTLLKIMEEAGELARAVLQFAPFSGLGRHQIIKIPKVFDLFIEVIKELLDVAQTGVTMIFVIEDTYGVKADDLVEKHLKKLVDKNYLYDREIDYKVATINNFKQLTLPKLEIPDVDLMQTVCKIQEELGELTQYLGKKAGASGEQASLETAEIIAGCAEELLDIAQCCFTMIYIIEEQYGYSVDTLLTAHIEKLRERGYIKD